MSELRGICPIIATPFTAKGAVDYDSLENLIRVLIQGGCQAVTLFGIAGEYYKLTDDEMKKMARLMAMPCFSPPERLRTSVLTVIALEV